MKLRLNLEDFFQDDRKLSLVDIDLSINKLVHNVIISVGKLFDLPHSPEHGNLLAFFIDDCYIHPDLNSCILENSAEPLRLKLVNFLVNSRNDDLPSTSRKKRKRKSAPDPIDDDFEEAILSKKKKKRKAVKDDDNIPNLNKGHTKKKKKSKNGFLTIENSTIPADEPSLTKKKDKYKIDELAQSTNINNIDISKCELKVPKNKSKKKDNKHLITKEKMVMQLNEIYDIIPGPSTLPIKKSKHKKHVLENLQGSSEVFKKKSKSKEVIDGNVISYTKLSDNKFKHIANITYENQAISNELSCKKYPRSKDAVNKFESETILQVEKLNDIANVSNDKINCHKSSSANYITVSRCYGSSVTSDMLSDTVFKSSDENKLSPNNVNITNSDISDNNSIETSLTNTIPKKKRHRKHNKKNKNKVKFDVIEPYKEESSKIVPQFESNGKHTIFNNSTSDYDYERSIKENDGSNNKLISANNVNSVSNDAVAQKFSLWNVKDELSASKIIMERQNMREFETSTPVLNYKTVGNIYNGFSGVIKKNPPDTSRNSFTSLSTIKDGSVNDEQANEFNTLLSFAESHDITVFKFPRIKDKKTSDKKTSIIEKQPLHMRNDPPNPICKEFSFITELVSQEFSLLLTMEATALPLVFSYETPKNTDQIASSKKIDSKIEVPTYFENESRCGDTNKNESLSVDTNIKHDFITTPAHVSRPTRPKTKPRVFSSLGTFLSKLKENNSILKEQQNLTATKAEDSSTTNNLSEKKINIEEKINTNNSNETLVNSKTLILEAIPLKHVNDTNKTHLSCDALENVVSDKVSTNYLSSINNKDNSQDLDDKPDVPHDLKETADSSIDVDKQVILPTSQDSCNGDNKDNLNSKEDGPIHITSRNNSIESEDNDNVKELSSVKEECTSILSDSKKSESGLTKSSPCSVPMICNDADEEKPECSVSNKTSSASIQIVAEIQSTEDVVLLDDEVNINEWLTGKMKQTSNIDAIDISPNNVTPTIDLEELDKGSTKNEKITKMMVKIDDEVNCITLESEKNEQQSDNDYHFKQKYPVLKSLPRPGELIIGRIQHKNSYSSAPYQRAIVTKVNDMMVGLRFIDKSGVPVVDLDKDTYCTTIDLTTAEGEERTLDWRDIKDPRLVFP